MAEQVVEKTKELILKVNHSNEFNDSAPGYAYVCLAQRFCQGILADMLDVKQRCERDSSFYCFSRFNYHPIFFTKFNKNEELLNELDESACMELDDGESYIADESYSRIGVSILHIAEDRIYWTANEKHSTDRLETMALPRSLIEEIAKE